MNDGYVELQYPADSATPDERGIVREQHVDAYLAEGWRRVEDESEVTS